MPKKISLEKIIEKRLKATQKCEYKKAFIPKGWACVHIKTFSKGLSKELKEIK